MTLMASLPTQSINFTTTRCIFLSFLCISFCCVAGINDGGDFGYREFDYFMLSLLWPGTSCTSTRHCCSFNACCTRSNSLTEFTIRKSNYHILDPSRAVQDGLWPDYNDGTWPACCTGKRFDVKEISTLLDVLNKYWPSLSCDSPSNCHGGKGLFWEHEWEKHGTCSSPAVHDEYDYFVKALNLYFKYNVTEVLREAGYVASNSEKYPLGGIVSAIQNAFHATPELVCSDDAIDELRLCFNKDFKIQDCAVRSITKSGIITSENSCPKYVSLPEVPLKLEDEVAEASQSIFKSAI